MSHYHDLHSNQHHNEIVIFVLMSYTYMLCLCLIYFFVSCDVVHCLFTVEVHSKVFRLMLRLKQINHEFLLKLDIKIRQITILEL